MRILAAPRVDVWKDWPKLAEAERKGEDVSDSWSVAKSRWYSARSRLDTFEHVPGGWPAWKDVPSAEQLAEWGFTYLGRADHVR